MKTAVLLYLYDTTLWLEYKKLLEPIKSEIDLFLALSSDNFCQNNTLIAQEASESFNCTISILPNKGVDIGPFLLQIKELDVNKYPYFIKLHGKKSLWGVHKNISWRSLLVHSLIGNKQIFNKNLELLNSNCAIGTIGNTGLLLSREKEGFNTELIFHILHNYLHIPLEQIARHDLSFLAGSIFMSRTEIFKQYFTNDIIDSIYTILPEGAISDSVEGKLPHSLERIFGYIVNFSNLQFANGYVDSKIILVNKDNSSKYDLVSCYDNTCYVDSNILYSGTKFEISPKHLLINWKHNNKNGFWKKYTKIKNGLYYN
jgi:lipopolysaccharide biosynthesis protein